MTPITRMPAILAQTRILPMLFSRSQPLVSLKRSFHTSEPALRVDKADPFFSSPFFRLFKLIDKRPDEQQLEKIYSEFQDCPNSVENELKEKELKEKEKFLFKAAEKGDLAGIKQLVSQGADIYCAENDSGQTVLMIAAKKGHIHIMEYCLSQAKNDDFSPFRDPDFSSIRRKNAFLRQKIGNHGEFIDRTDNLHLTALYHAAFHEKWEACNFLIRNGAYLEVNKIPPYTMLMLVITKGTLEQVKYFEKAGVSFHSNLNDETPLMSAVDRSKYDIVSYLIKKRKVDIDAMDRSGRTALSRAVMKGHFSMVKLLLVNGASPSLAEWCLEPEELARSKNYDQMADYIKSFKKTSIFDDFIKSYKMATKENGMECSGLEILVGETPTVIRTFREKPEYAHKSFSPRPIGNHF